MKTTWIAVIVMSFLNLSAHAENLLSDLPQAVANLHHGTSVESCQESVPGKVETYVIDQDTKLYLVPCSKNELQNSSRGYLYNSANKFASQVTILERNEETHTIGGTVDLVTASYDPKTKTLTTYSKNSSLGDCGQMAKSKVSLSSNGQPVIATNEIRAKNTCDGRMSPWPTVYRQTAKR